MLHVVGFGGDVLEQLRWMEGVACLLSRSGDHLVMCWAPLEFMHLGRVGGNQVVFASGGGCIRLCCLCLYMFWKRRVVSAFCRSLL